MTRYIVTADPPTPNGDLHVGHLSGPYYAADALTRALRVQGHDVAHYSNLDAHQTYVVSTALRLGTTPEQVAERFSESIASTLAAASMGPDVLGRPDAAQGEFVARFFERLYAQGHLLVRDAILPYCGDCGHHMFETYIQGLCPHCGAGCYGNTCEECGLPHLTEDTREARCRHCGEPPSERVRYRGLFLPLERHRDKLREYLESRRGIWRSQYSEFLLPRFAEPLPDIPLTLPCDYGLPVTIPGFEGQVFNVRLEIIAALIHTFDLWKSWAEAVGGEEEIAAWDWRDDPESVRMVCFHGLENGYQYGMSFHALLLASDLGWGAPYAGLTNEFYLLDGHKFSTTRNHAIWGADILRRVDPDALRFYLAYTAPEEEQTNFVLDDFRAKTDEILIDPWNRFAERPADPSANDGPASESFGARLAEIDAEMVAAYDVNGFSLRRAARGLARAVALLDESAQGGASRADLTAGLHAFSVWAEPILPNLADRIRRRLGVPARRPTDGWETEAPGPWDPRELRLAPIAQADLDGLQSASLGHAPITGAGATAAVRPPAAARAR